MKPKITDSDQRDEKTIADGGEARKKKEMGEPGGMASRANFQRL